MFSPRVFYDGVEYLEKLSTSSLNYFCMQSICTKRLSYSFRPSLGHLYIQCWVGLNSMLSAGRCFTVDSSLGSVVRWSFLLVKSSCRGLAVFLGGLLLVSTQLLCFGKNL